MRKFVPILLMLPLTARADNQKEKEIPPIKATRVAGQVWVLESGGKMFDGGNIAASIGPDGILLVDAKLAVAAPQVRATLARLSGKPVRFVINTHDHGDHAGGNAAFAPSAAIIGHVNARKNLMEDHDGKPLPEAGRPVITFEDKLSVHLNGEEIRAVHYPSGHTDADTFVFFTKSNVVVMGDNFFAGMYPFIDLESGGTVKGYIANLEKIVAGLPANARIIPGHGPVTSVKELRAFIDMLRGTSAIVEAGIKAGKTVDGLKKAKVFSKYDAAWGRGYQTSEQFIDRLYGGLKAKKR